MQFSTLFSYMLWGNELKFYIRLCFNVLQIQFECCHFASNFEGVSILEIHSFPQFSPTCFDIFRWIFAHGFVLMYNGSRSSVINLCQFLKALCLFWNIEYRKCAVFRTFLLHALTYWAEILNMTFKCTTEQVRVLSLCVNFWRGYASLWT